MVSPAGGATQSVSDRSTSDSARVLRLLTGQRGVGIAPVLEGASGVDLADLLQGAGERVQVVGVLMASLPQAEDDGRRTPLLRKVAQVPERSTESGSAAIPWSRQDRLTLG